MDYDRTTDKKINDKSRNKMVGGHINDIQTIYEGELKMYGTLSSTINYTLNHIIHFSIDCILYC